MDIPIGTLREGELALINALTKKPLSEEEVYAFSVTLCDNDIDRDYERFSDEALLALEKLFVGKTGIFDHAHKAENQLARVFSCRLETCDNEWTVDGRPYKKLSARAYMLRSDKNRDLINELEGGIKKEVSVSCGIKGRYCSVCGTSRAVGCAHRAGTTYKTEKGDTVCHTILDEAFDAYEWSFVAVPAQRRAGVTKSYNRKEKKMKNSDIFTALSKGEEVTLSPSDASALHKKLSDLSALSAVGEQFLSERRAAVIKGLCGCLPEVSEEILKGIGERLTLPELSALFCAFEQKAPKIQLSREKKAADNNGFIIK